jgi:hypothetical protein
MYAATKEHFSDRKLKKATEANYVHHRESSIKTITRKNLWPGTHLPTLLPASKEQAAVAKCFADSVARWKYCQKVRQHIQHQVTADGINLGPARRSMRAAVTCL